MSTVPLPVSDPHAVTQATTLPGLFQARAGATPEASAYLYHHAGHSIWQTRTWKQMLAEAGRWRSAFQTEGLEPGDRVAIMLNNSIEWVCCDMAAQSLGLATVPLYTNDRPENISYILNHCEARLLFLAGHEHCGIVRQVFDELPRIQRFVCVGDDCVAEGDTRCLALNAWLPESGEYSVAACVTPGSLATIIYTSGTTGAAKGVMLSHQAILWNVRACLEAVPAYPSDLFLSFLPLSHAFERTVGYYLPMRVGAQVAYARSAQLLAEDLQAVRPTVVVSVPRLFERMYTRVQTAVTFKPRLARYLFRQTLELGWKRFVYQQGLARGTAQLLLWPLLRMLVANRILRVLGPRLRLAICGGAALPPNVARLFISLGLPILQGYGMTELAPVVSVNPLADNDPASVGIPLNEVEVMTSEQNELLVRSPGLMLGYWKGEATTAPAVDAEGWLHTGDKARIQNNHIYITGRLKEIIVMSNGEKVPPGDMEMAIAEDPFFDQVLIHGEARSYLVALVVINREAWLELCQQWDLIPDEPATYRHPELVAKVLERVAFRLRRFPGYAQVRKVLVSPEPWTVENGLITPTLKVRRPQLAEYFRAQIDALYRSKPT